MLPNLSHLSAGGYVAVVLVAVYQFRRYQITVIVGDSERQEMVLVI